ncbi:MAG: glycine betaine/L-proline ABC transporter substrate-binding protein ProX [Symploca sp. SIO3C6]|uniref:Glycine betaine/L-proline ABC transporter substrate-binding protein ProX n=1 Tax=Symploca sp. SIO1C4 TaxID=2607765 RepID=A0A6B3NAA5_9CYAN|nr:glycine betaine/L-proline ABC transporter substrate-binding protein ProX [Symploca sp. SIO3C6]NER30029.1 glycine betaine/L-proline ABC transporter substrate-binding protein ProX [Symploca sp. SIO1C4]NET04369.1 glycine betaine/L-proline ABC transporter substrate-binding protein ProX [Symploca sp. SIO2B6]
MLMLHYSSFIIRKLTFGIAATISVVSLVACQETPQATKLRTAYIDSEGIFQQEVVNIALEKLGYELEVKQLEPTSLHFALGNGDLDFFCAHWEKLYREFFEKSGGKEKLERVGVIVNNALQGYQIDKKTADQYKITNLKQLKDPKIAGLFDSDGDGKADMTGCNPGWGCELVIEHHLDAYGLKDTVEHNQGSYNVLIADTISRYRKGKPVLYYTWTPFWLGAVLKLNRDVVWLEVPFTDLPKGQAELTPKDTSIEGKNLGFAVDRIITLATKEFLETNPEAKRLFELVEIPIEDINAQNQLLQEGEDSSKDIRRHAEEWIEENQELFDNWIEEASKLSNNAALPVKSIH